MMYVKKIRRYLDKPTIEPFKSRYIVLGVETQVYRNLNRKGVYYSLVQGGLVVGHGYDFALNNVDFIVSEAGRQRAIIEGRRNVHAKCVGELSHIKEQVYKQLTYNPFKNKTFVDTDGSEQREAETVIFTQHGVYFKPTMK